LWKRRVGEERFVGLMEAHASVNGRSMYIELIFNIHRAPTQLTTQLIYIVGQNNNKKRQSNQMYL